MSYAIVKFTFLGQKGNDMKQVCAMCGKEHISNGCLDTDAFGTYGASVGVTPQAKVPSNYSTWDFLRDEGFSPSDYFCKHCRDRLLRKHKAVCGWTSF